MKDSEDIRPDDYEDEDIFDVVIKLEKSFSIKFEKNAFIKVKTFGDLCDILESYIKYDHKEDCTKQQAFYKIRTAISETQLINKGQINPGTKLVELFPRHNRRTQVKKFQKLLGVNLKLLTYSGWLALTFVIGILSSFIAFFFDWKIAVSGIVFFTLAHKIAGILGRDFEFDTVKDLTEKATTDHYIDIRRSKLTVNRNEILTIIKDAFRTGLSIDNEQLERDAKFIWA